MVELTNAHEELFRRSPDEVFDSLEELRLHCRESREQSQDRWIPADRLNLTGGLTLCLDDSDYQLCDWSFSQLCKLARVSKDTLNRLSPKTASRALEETLPSPEGGKPLQTLTTGETVRSIHGTAYTRLWNDDLLEAVAQSAPTFTPPHKAAGGGTGLYCGEQDLFCFLIGPTGWAEIDGEAFAPGFFVWNSEVGRRSLGVQTFWFQAVCANHIVWDAAEIVSFSRKHTANVRDGLVEIRRIIDRLVTLRDQRRDSFVSVMRRAATERLGDSADDVMKVLTREGVGKSAA